MKKLLLIVLIMILLWGAFEFTHIADSAGGWYRGVKLPYYGGQARNITNDGSGHGAGRHALDIGMIYEEVLAIHAGRVVATTVDWGGGNTIILDHRDGHCSLYMHLSEFWVRAGQEVTQGQRIARSGNTGNKTSGAHLHLAVVRGCAGIGNEVAMIFDELPHRELVWRDRVISRNGTPASPYYPTIRNLSNTSVEVWWNDYSFNEVGFGVEVSTGRSGWQQVATVVSDTITFKVTGLKAVTPYCFRVRAYNEAGSSPYSNATCVTTTKAQNPTANAAPNQPTKSNNNEKLVPQPPSGTLTPEQQKALQSSLQGDGKSADAPAPATNKAPTPSVQPQSPATQSIAQSPASEQATPEELRAWWGKMRDWMREMWPPK